MFLKDAQGDREAQRGRRDRRIRAARRSESFLDVVERGVDLAAVTGPQLGEGPPDRRGDRLPLKMAGVHQQQRLGQAAPIGMRQAEGQIVAMDHSGALALAPDQSTILFDAVELRQLVPAGVDRDLERVFEKRDQFEHAERVDHACREQGIVVLQRSSAERRAKPRSYEAGDDFMHVNGPRSATAAPEPSTQQAANSTTRRTADAAVSFPRSSV